MPEAKKELIMKMMLSVTDTTFLQNQFSLSDGAMKLFRDEFDVNTRVTDEKREKLREHTENDVDPTNIARLLELPVNKVIEEITIYMHSGKKYMEKSEPYPKEGDENIDRRLIKFDQVRLSLSNDTEEALEAGNIKIIKDKAFDP